MKLIWSYIKEHDVQDPKDKREILCDEKLEGLFKRKKINMFKMTQKIATVSICYVLQYIPYVNTINI